MASPFTVFRKNQKAMLAILGILCMFGFVIGPTLMDRLGSRGQNLNPVVVTTKYGDLKESDLQRMVALRAQVLGFFREVVARVVGRDIPGMAEQMFGEPSEQSVVETMLLSKKAEELGLVVSDKTVNEFLKEITGGAIAADQLKGFATRQRMSESQLFAALRAELAAMQVRRAFAQSASSVSPAMRWEYFQRLNRRVTAEVAPVRAADMVAQVKDPDAKELAEFFEQYKETYPNPASPIPGFKIPKKADFQYFRADYARFLQPDKVTDQEIQEYYDKNKDQLYLNVELPSADKGTGAEVPPGKKTEPDTSAKGTAPEKTPAEKPAPKETPAKETPSKETAPKENPAKEAAPAETPAKEAPAKEAAPAETPAKEAPAKEDAPAKDAPAKDAPAKDGSVSVPLAPAAALFGMVEDSKPEASGEKKDAAAEEKAPDAKAPDAKAPETKAPETKAPEEKAPEEKSPETKAPEAKAPEGKAPEAKAPGGKTPEAKAPEAKAPEGKAPEGKAPEAKKPQYKPLAEVKDEIRKTLAGEKARTQMEEVLRGLSDQMRTYADARLVWNAKRQDDPSLVEPTPLDFPKVAEKNQVTTLETGLITELQARDTDIGKSVIDGSTPFVGVAYGTLPDYKPVKSEDNEGNGYVFWKTKGVNERVPRLDEPAVKAAVLKQWKLIKARKLALDKAKALADQARKAKKPLKEVFAGNKAITVTQTDPFSWMTRGSAAFAYNVPARLSEVKGVEMAGMRFMEAVFGLGVGEVGVATNQPETIDYVVRIESSDPAPAVLHELFMAEDFGQYAQLAAYDQAQIRSASMKQIEDEAGLHWADPTRRAAGRGRGTGSVAP